MTICLDNLLNEIDTIIKSQKVRQETFFLDVRLAALKFHLQCKTPPSEIIVDDATKRT